MENSSNQIKTKAQSQSKKRKFSRPTTAIKHKKVLAKLVENGGNMSKAIRDTGLYSSVIANDPQKILNSKTWNEVVEDQLSDGELMQKHKQLLNATRIDHMVFPTGPRKDADKKEGDDVLSDEEIIGLLAEVNCKVRRIVHGENARHVYFWSNDNKARKEALDMAYKLKGRYEDADKPNPQTNTTYNFIFSSEVREKVKIIEGEIKDMLVKPHAQTS